MDKHHKYLKFRLLFSGIHDCYPLSKMTKVTEFCIGKKNWQMIDTIHGAKSSAIIYSIVKTAKANNLKPFDYVQHLLEEIPKHMNDKDCSFLEDLLPLVKKTSGRDSQSLNIGGCKAAA